MIINLKHAELENCLNFAKKAALNHNGHPFGAWDQPERAYEESKKAELILHRSPLRCSKQFPERMLSKYVRRFQVQSYRHCYDKEQRRNGEDHHNF